MTIAGLVLTYNGGRLFERCLASLSFCDSVLIVDCGSTDGTTEVATQAGAKVIFHQWEAPVPQFRFAVDYLEKEMPSDWIFSLDEDEFCSPELQTNLLTALRTAPADLAGFMIARRSWYFDRFLMHSGWYPDRLYRCFRRGQMRLENQDGHQKFVPLGKTAIVSGDIIHYPYKDFMNHLEKINIYAERGAEILRNQGCKGGIGLGLLHGFGRFLRIYLVKAGFLDGRAGFINAAHGAFYAFLKYVRVEKGNWGK